MYYLIYLGYTRVYPGCDHKMKTLTFLLVFGSFNAIPLRTLLEAMDKYFPERLLISENFWTK